jgi:rod shape-determining protein MreC
MQPRRIRALVPGVLVLLAVLGFLLHQVGVLQPVEKLVLRLLVPLQRPLSGLADNIADLVSTVRDLGDLRQRNQELEAENARLLLENVRLREVQAENVALRRLLNFAQANPSFDYRAGQVVGRAIGYDPINVLRTILIDVGQESGLAPNMPVVTDRGLVGRVIDVGIGWAKVLLINDLSSSVNAMTQSTHATGLILGRSDGGLLMANISQDEAISVGDVVFTSGLGGNLPRGILIGQITEVTRRDVEMFQEAAVQPTVDLDHLEYVLVYTSFEPTTPLEDELESTPAAP